MLRYFKYFENGNFAQKIKWIFARISFVEYLWDLDKYAFLFLENQNNYLYEREFPHRLSC